MQAKQIQDSALIDKERKKINTRVRVKHREAGKTDSGFSIYRQRKKINMIVGVKRHFQ